VGDFNHPDICREDHTARHKKSRRFLQSIGDNFLTQKVEKPTRRGVLLDLSLTNKEGLVENVKVGGSLGCTDHEMVEFRILHGGSRAVSSITALDSGELALASSRTYLQESLGSGLRKLRGSKRAGHYLGIASSVLRISASP